MSPKCGCRRSSISPSKPSCICRSGCRRQSRRTTAGRWREQVLDLLACSRGRAFVLFTSYAMLRTVRDLIELELPYPLLVQGTAPRSVLLNQFRATPNAVLLATSSFWQGVDVVGEQLSCVIIDKLPFASPGRPDHRGADRGHRRRRARRVSRVPGAARHPVDAAGTGPPDPSSDGPRRARRARSAAADDGLRPAVPGFLPAGADHPQAGRGQTLFRGVTYSLGLDVARHDTRHSWRLGSWPAKRSCSLGDGHVDEETSRGAGVQLRPGARVWSGGAVHDDQGQGRRRRGQAHGGRGDHHRIPGRRRPEIPDQDRQARRVHSAAHRRRALQGDRDRREGGIAVRRGSRADGSGRRREHRADAEHGGQRRRPRRRR